MVFLGFGESMVNCLMVFSKSGLIVFCFVIILLFMSSNCWGIVFVCLVNLFLFWLLYCLMNLYFFLNCIKCVRMFDVLLMVDRVDV